MFISDLSGVRGALLGLAIGDALGAPLEGLPAPMVPVRDFEAGGLFPRKAGDLTDDTLMAIAVAESLARCRGFSPEDCMSRMIGAYRKAPEWFGPTSGSVFERVMNGENPEQAVFAVHRSHGSRTNGTVTRGIPAGLFYTGTSVGEVSRSLARLTHFDPVAGDCSAFVNRMVSGLVRGATRADAYRSALPECRSDELLDRVSRWEQFTPEPGLDAVLCTHTALACFMTAGTFEQAVLTAINLGGDADSVGALCGALAGAYYGKEAIPGRWPRNLQASGGIVELADKLWAASRPG